MDIQNKRISNDEFEKLRREVLAQWPTGKDVDLQEAVDYHKSMPEARIFSKKLVDAKNAGKTLVQPRAGVPVLEEHIKLMQYLESEGEADLLPTTIDSYTRQNRYEEAENGLAESIRLGRAMMNGFPAVNHGVANCRRVIESVNTPLQVRHGTPDARLLTEITYAGGFTSYEGGGISYNLPYCKN
ncbi:MAG: methylaspartate mutase subunit E, partial [Oscillospiraceae bacterium]|nr:methylaspartate mutase subunit E [Oscillospiraceae bacterium]